jgi:membrane protease subunit (stomatin/prohibitin family)
MIPVLSMQPDEDVRSPPHPHKTRDFTQSRRRMKTKTNFVFRTRETKQLLDKIHELQQKLYIKDINQTYSPLNTP